MRLIKKGATSQSIYFSILDSASTTGGKKTGIVYNAAGLTAYYTLNGAAAVSITLATLATASTAWSSGGFVEVSSTNTPGLYRLDVPNAGLTGADSVVVSLKGAAGMVQVDVEIQLTGIDIMDAVRGGMTALPNANAEAAGGLYTRGTGAGQINQDANGRVDANAKAWIGGAIPAVNVTGVPLIDLKYTLGTISPATAGSVRADAVTGAVGSVTGAVGSVTGAVGSVTGAVGSVTGAVGSVGAGGINRATFAADTGLVTIRSNTAQAGGATSITLDASASATTDFYKNDLIVITGGTGIGQGRYCTAYNGSTKVATVSAWATNPDVTSTFAIIAADAIVGATAPTAAAVATAVWTNLLAGSDFSTASSVGKLLKDDVDATISSRMATFTQPTGFLAATFPTTVASPTNITAATGIVLSGVTHTGAVIPTVTTTTTATNLTNAPTAGDLTAAMKASVTTAATAATPTAAAVTGAVGSVTGNVGGSVASVVGAVGSVTGLTASNLDAAISSRAAASVLGAAVGASISADIAAVKSDTAATLGQTGTTGVVIAAASKTGFRLSATGVDDLWAYLESNVATAGSMGLKLKNTLPQRITKNTALAKFPFVMIDAADHLTGKTGLTVTAQRSIDGAAFGACSNSPAEVGSGVYSLDLSASDLNGNTITLKFSATGADNRLITLITEPAAA